MDYDSLSQIIGLIFFILLSAFFSSAETALIACNKIRVQIYEKDGRKSAKILMKIFEQSEKMLSTILIGNNIANIASSALMTTFMLNKFGSYAISLGAGILTLVVLIFGEITPKSIATQHATEISMKYAVIIYVLIKIFTPFLYIINGVSKGFIRLFGTKKIVTSKITEQEIKALIEFGEKEGVIEKEEKTIINNILEFTDAKVKEVMTQRIDMVFINVDDDYNSIIENFKENKFTRLPVYENTKDEVIGIVNIKDFLLNEYVDIRKIMNPAFFTYENKHIGDLMIEMRKSNINIAIVIDEYGMTAGLLTMEDLLEELVGEIRDEYDYDEYDEIISNVDGSYTLDSATKLDDINEIFDLDIEGDGYDNIAGFILKELNHIPRFGESVRYKDYKFTVIKVENNRIISINARKLKNK